MRAADLAQYRQLSDIEDAYSDSEALHGRRSLQGLKGGTKSMVNVLEATRRPLVDGNVTDEEEMDHSLDDFAGNNIKAPSGRLVRTGRQRKKLAARSKGGEFQTRRRKRRIYFCCICSEIDVQKLYDYLLGSGSLMNGWEYHVHCDVLHLFKRGAQSPDIRENQRPREVSAAEPFDPLAGSLGVSIFEETSPRETSAPQFPIIGVEPQSTVSAIAADGDFRISSPGSLEVFVYEFGAAVFWGFPRGTEANILKAIRMFVMKGLVGPEEFHSGEDDMAFVTAPDIDTISIANDVISLPDDAATKQRLSVSFAIAQSTVLAIFEARVEQKVEEYRYIPETLAAHGRVHLTERQLGMMIGEVFVIRHDVNLHSEILDTPDFFWKDGEKYENDYKLIMSYLEMSGRTEVLNKRLDMLRELLDVLQEQMESAHAVKLEWIVIWLIVMEVVLQTIATGGESLGFW